jgi:hypothetical protein
MSSFKAYELLIERSSPFNPREGKGDLKWSTIAQKPRYSEEMESGVLYFVVSAKTQSEKWGVRGGNVAKDR